MKFNETKEYKDTMAKAELIKDPVEKALFWLSACAALLEAIAPIETYPTVFKIKDEELEYSLTDEELMEKN